MPKRILPSTLKAQDPILMRAIGKICSSVVRRPSSVGSAGRSTPRRTTDDATNPRAFLVGGFVRDLALKQHPKDADLEVYGVDAKTLEAMLKKLFPGRVNATGKAFGVFKVNIGRHQELDVALPRRESKVSKGHKGFSITGDPSMEIAEAARRRDFTMNAMLLDPKTGEIIDPYHGLDDLASHTLRIVDPATFGEDPLRIYRAIQFAGRFGMETDPKSTKLLRDMVKRGMTDELPKERITEELRKLLLRSERPSIGLNLARVIGLIERDYPELHKLTQTPQRSGSHNEGTAWDHTMYVLDGMAKLIRDPKWTLTDHERIVLMLTAITHDLGKTVAPWRVVQHISYAFADHPRAGGVPAATFLNHFSFSDDTNTQVVMLTMNHRRGGVILDQIRQKECSEDILVNERRKLIRDISPITWNAYLVLSSADTLGVIGWNSRQQAHDLVTKLDRLVKKYRILKLAQTSLLTGADLMKLGMKPSPAMGSLLKEIEKARDDGRIKTKKDAIQLAKNLMPDKIQKAIGN